jgi:hypothetical protein
LIHYLDTSLLVAAFTNETRTQEMQSWLGRQTPGSLAISEGVVTEFSAALSIKLWTSQIAAAHRAGALSMFGRTADESFVLLPNPVESSPSL